MLKKIGWANKQKKKKQKENKKIKIYLDLKTKKQIRNQLFYSNSNLNNLIYIFFTLECALCILILDKLLLS
jgi:hypothetical protein